MALKYVSDVGKFSGAFEPSLTSLLGNNILQGDD